MKRKTDYGYILDEQPDLPDGKTIRKFPKNVEYKWDYNYSIQWLSSMKPREQIIAFSNLHLN